jgi:hypothetical protein
MPCTNCGEDTEIARYSLQFERANGDLTELELELCDDCLTEILSERWISKV